MSSEFQFDQQRSFVCFLALELQPGQLGLARTLPRTATEELGALIAREFTRLCPGIEALDLAFVGALYEPDELLKPGLGWAQWLNDQQRLAGAQLDTAQLLFFGERDGRMPIRELEPNPSRPSGVLKLMPIVLRGAPEKIALIGAQLESSLTEIGIAGPPVLGCVAGWCGHSIAHGCYMTLLDVLAFERAQFEQLGLSALSDLLEIVFLSPTRQEVVRQTPQIEWLWNGREAEGRFLGRQAWQAKQTDPKLTYLDYLRAQRSIAAGLAAFGIPMLWLDEKARPAVFIVEREACTEADSPLLAEVDAELGLIALSATRNAERVTYWPLDAQARDLIEADFART